MSGQASQAEICLAGPSLLIWQSEPRFNDAQVTSKKDQEQYWADPSKPYRFVPVKVFADAFAASPVGKRNAEEMSKSCGPPKEPPVPDPLIRQK